LKKAARLYFRLIEDGVDAETALLHTTTPFDFKQKKYGKSRRVFVNKAEGEGPDSDGSEGQQDDDEGPQDDDEGQQDDNDEDDKVSKDDTNGRVQSHVDAKLLCQDLLELSSAARDRYLQRLTALELGAVMQIMSQRVQNMSCLRQAVKALLDAKDV
jgi:hypothetical protein